MSGPHPALLAGGAPAQAGRRQVSTTLESIPSEHLTLGDTSVADDPGERIGRAGGRSGSFAAGWPTVTV